MDSRKVTTCEAATVRVRRASCGDIENTVGVDRANAKNACLPVSLVTLNDAEGIDPYVFKI
jgi:hypothetical protein